MISSKIKIVSAAVAAVAVVVSSALAFAVHNGAVATDHGYGVHHVVGPDGSLIGSAPNALRAQLQQDGLPD